MQPLSLTDSDTRPWWSYVYSTRTLSVSLATPTLASLMSACDRTRLSTVIVSCLCEYGKNTIPNTCKSVWCGQSLWSVVCRVVCTASCSISCVRLSTPADGPRGGHSCLPPPLRPLQSQASTCSSVSVSSSFAYPPAASLGARPPLRVGDVLGVMRKRCPTRDAAVPRPRPLPRPAAAAQLPRPATAPPPPSPVEALLLGGECSPVTDGAGLPLSSGAAPSGVADEVPKLVADAASTA